MVTSNSDVPRFMTQAAFARLKDVSKKTTTKWKQRGWLKLSGNLVDVAATESYMARYAPSRSKAAHKGVTSSINSAANAVKVTPQVDGSLPEDSASEYEMQNLISLDIECGGSTLAYITARILPLGVVKSIVLEWYEHEVRSWAGDGASYPSMAEELEWQLPPGCASWRDHRYFSVQRMMGALEWDEIESEAAAWREERGLEPL